MAPLRRVPHPTAFTVVQQGPYVEVRGSLNPATMDGNSIEEATLNIWRDERPEGGAGYPSTQIFKETAKIVTTLRIVPRESTAFLWQDSVAEIVAANVKATKEAKKREAEQSEETGGETEVQSEEGDELVVKEIFYGIEARNERGRRGPFSKIVRILPKSYVEPPRGLKMEVTETAVRFWWNPSPPVADKLLGYLVYRRSGEGAAWERLTGEPIEETLYEDEDFRFGQTYEYRIRTVVPGGAESLDSETQKVTPIDTFPPTIPQGLSASVEEDGVRLFWFPNEEEDLAGYHVYRASEDGPFVRITTDLVTSTIFPDEAVEVEKKYTYHVTAMDKTGNESGPSENVERLVRAEPVF